MSEITSYRDLEVWKKSMMVAENVYKIAREMPDSEKYGLTSQICRCAVSIPSNIAEGFGQGEGNYHRHVRIARGSLMELETQLELCVRLNLVSRDIVVETWKTIQETGKMLTVLASRLKESI